MIIMCRDYFDIPSDASPEIKKVRTLIYQAQVAVFFYLITHISLYAFHTQFHEALMGKLPDNVNKLYSPVSLLVYFLKKGADMHIEDTSGQSPLKLLPYLANLMTVLADNEELL